MNLTSLTMVGRFPDGIDLHVRNLRWALPEQARSVVVTYEEYIRDYHLRGDGRVTYIACGEPGGPGGFYHFWRDFPGIVRDHGLEPDWFLFMEQDIWFMSRIHDELPQDADEIRGFLPPVGYHSVLRDGEMYLPRIWEGAMLISGGLVRRALDRDIDFAGLEEPFINQSPGYWNQIAGGEITLKYYEFPDTMDQFNLYCALVEKTRVTHTSRAVHLQGPEGLHRLRPEIYDGCDAENLEHASNEWGFYICPYAAAAIYFIAGNWTQEADWGRIQRRYRPEFRSLIPSAREWMRPDEYERLERVVSRLSTD